ncbi:MAG: hypothetical protein JXR97_13755 [Planctomycetes bacterium]|nr:hypothetical protein [Planctomycetota bacterium]
MNIKAIKEWNIGTPIMQIHILPVRLGSGKIDALAMLYSNSLGSNPWIEMFSFPTDTYKLAVYDLSGKCMWCRDLGPGVIADPCFCPVFALDLDEDGKDEIYFLNNIDPEHPMAISKFKLERADAETGATTAQVEWPGYNAEGPMTNAFRNIISGGYANGKPVLLTAQGMYEDMYLQGWSSDLTKRWEVEIPEGSRGARGSHMHPVVDINKDGIDEWMWGERCIAVDTGKELFCCDDETYSGHSDTIQPFIDPATRDWLLFTSRAKQQFVSPRVAVYDNTGKRIWGAVDSGHMHIGWVARFSEEARTAMAIRIGTKKQTRQSREIHGRVVFAFDAVSGTPVELPFDPYQTIPVDLNGDGLHELVRGTWHDGNCSGEVIDGKGNVLGSVDGPVAFASKFLDLPGEQVITYAKDGTLRIWADTEAEDSPLALARYENSFYHTNQRACACGNHKHVLGGL